MKNLFLVLVVSSIICCLQNNLLAQSYSLNKLSLTDLEVAVLSASLSKSFSATLMIEIEGYQLGKNGLFFKKNWAVLYRNYRQISNPITYPLTYDYTEGIAIRKKATKAKNYFIPSFLWFSRRNTSVSCILPNCAPHWNGNN